MKNLLTVFRRIWSIKELRTRIGITLFFLLVYRLGSYIPLPGIDPDNLASLEDKTSSGLLGLLNSFTGGALSKASIFALGIMPYISASIIMQLLGIAVPYFSKLQKEGDSGRRKMNQITRILTIFVCLIQSPGYLASIQSILPREAFLTDFFSFWSMSILILTTGTMFAMWMGEKITERGIGNGISLLITVGIIASLPVSIGQEISSKLGGQQGGVIVILLEFVALFFVIILSIMLTQAVRRIPIQYARSSASGDYSSSRVAVKRQYIPLKLNSSGVMPIIFAQAIMFIPSFAMGFFDSDFFQYLKVEFSDINGLIYNIVFVLMIILFTYFYTAITMPVDQMAGDMKRSGSFIPGISPGKNTSSFLDNIMSKITLPASLFLALIAIFPIFAYRMGVEQSFALFYGGTSLLIIVGVILDTLQQVDTYLLNHKYDGLMTSNKFR